MAAQRVIVVGAGYAGLAAARALERTGVEVLVLEAQQRVGGRVWSERLANGGVIERGGEFISRGYETFERLAAELGLELAGMGIHYPDRRVEPDPGLPREAVLSGARAADEAAQAAPDGRPALQVLR